ncbi:hypothetical protein ACFUS2_12930 [[Kitasatospora] papulosa]|uniref:hypothetical protein n=1 Tax=[Kitasatospora] papulosa TaxID=1464011 RepID=UPI00363658C4
MSILAPALTAAAEEAITAAFALRDAPNEQTLETLPESALTAADRFVAAAAHHFA